MYQAPLTDLRFVLNELLRAPQLAELRAYAEFSAELSDSILDEPHASAGSAGGRSMSSATRAAPSTGMAACTCRGVSRRLCEFIAAGWPQLSAPADRGGQGAPLVLAVACEEIWFGANLAFMLCPQLSRVVSMRSSRWRPRAAEPAAAKLVSGEWTGTMNLTEHSRLGPGIDTHAAHGPTADHLPHLRQKIFITYGDHDMAENIVHLLSPASTARRRRQGHLDVAIPKRLSTRTAASAPPMICAACRSSTSWESMRARPA